jgi:predicted aspartyl protease
VYYRHVVGTARAAYRDDDWTLSDKGLLALPSPLQMEPPSESPRPAAIPEPESSLADAPAVGGMELWVPLRSHFVHYWPMVEARVLSGDGHEATGWFLLDTGCSMTVLDDAWARRMGLSVAATPKGSRSGQRGVARDVRVEVGPIPVESHRMWCFDFEPFSRASGVQICGAIGGDFFENHPVRIRYVQQVIEVGSRSWTPPAESIPLSIYRVKSCPHFAIDVRQGDGDPVRTEALIDTGFSGRMVCSQTFATSVGIVDEGDCGCRALMVTGQKEFKPARDISAIAGSFVIPAGEAFVSDVEGIDGLMIGGEVLGAYTLIVDYPRSRVVLAPAMP